MPVSDTPRGTVSTTSSYPASPVSPTSLRQLPMLSNSRWGTLDSPPPETPQLAQHSPGLGLIIDGGMTVSPTAIATPDSWTSSFYSFSGQTDTALTMFPFGIIPLTAPQVVREEDIQVRAAGIQALITGNEEEFTSLFRNNPARLQEYYWDFYVTCLLDNTKMLGFYIDQSSDVAFDRNATFASEAEKAGFFSSIELAKVILLSNGNLSAVEDLLQQGDCTLVQEHYWVLYAAALQGVSMLHFLLKNLQNIDLDLKIPNEGDDRLLHLVLRSPKYALREARGVIELLLSEGANPAVAGKLGDNALHTVVAEEAKIDWCNCLLENTQVLMSLNSRNSYWSTPLVVAASYNNILALQALLERGANLEIVAYVLYNPEQEFTEFTTALGVAVLKKSLEAVHVLLEAGAIINDAFYKPLEPLARENDAIAQGIIELLRNTQVLRGLELDEIINGVRGPRLLPA
jgi:hypothetical protein